MENLDILKTFSWIAVVLLSTSYWFQIYKIHIHKEVRDLSMAYHVLLAIGFGILTWTAWAENSTIFVVKQIATTVPVMIIIAQIVYHKNDHARISLDTRFQRSDRPLFEKYNEFDCKALCDIMYYIRNNLI